MSKAILVMDMPETCLECPFKYKSEEMPLGNYTYQSLFRCRYEPEHYDEDEEVYTDYLNDIMMKGKPDWCPLREVPQKKDEWIPTVIQDIEVCGRKKDKFVSGYNACIDEIMRGSEENE